MAEDDSLGNLYDRYLELTAELSEHYTSVELAAVMVAQAMSLYRTAMSEEDYENMAALIYEMRHKVKKFELPSLQ